jgi:hypothetical protein
MRTRRRARRAASSRSFAAAGKAVFDVEYVASYFSCPGPTGISVIQKSRDLYAQPSQSCQ